MKQFHLHLMLGCCAGLLFGTFSTPSAFAQPDPRLSKPALENPRLVPKHELNPNLDPKVKKHPLPADEDELKVNHESEQPLPPKPHAAAPDIKPIQNDPLPPEPIPENRVPTLNGPERIHVTNSDFVVKKMDFAKSNFHVSKKKPNKKVKHGKVMRKGALMCKMPRAKANDQLKSCMEQCNRALLTDGVSLNSDECHKHCSSGK